MQQGRFGRHCQSRNDDDTVDVSRDCGQFSQPVDAESGRRRRCVFAMILPGPAGTIAVAGRMAWHLRSGRLRLRRSSKARLREGCALARQKQHGDGARHEPA